MKLSNEEIKNEQSLMKNLKPEMVILVDAPPTLLDPKLNMLKNEMRDKLINEFSKKLG